MRMWLWCNLLLVMIAGTWGCISIFKKKEEKGESLPLLDDSFDDR